MITNLSKYQNLFSFNWPVSFREGIHSEFTVLRSGCFVVQFHHPIETGRLLTSDKVIDECDWGLSVVVLLIS